VKRRRREIAGDRRHDDGIGPKPLQNRVQHSWIDSVVVYQLGDKNPDESWTAPMQPSKGLLYFEVVVETMNGQSWSAQWGKGAHSVVARCVCSPTFLLSVAAISSARQLRNSAAT
jgi:hypothetical protein